MKIEFVASMTTTKHNNIKTVKFSMFLSYFDDDDDTTSHIFDGESSEQAISSARPPIDE
jgi:hypothetical protein